MNSSEKYSNNIDAGNIYKNFELAWKDANQKIATLDQLPSKKQAHVIQARANLVIQQNALYKAYKKHATSVNGTIGTFLDEAKPIQQKIDDVFNKAMGRLSIIKQIFRSSEKFVNIFQNILAKTESSLDLTNLEKRIAFLKRAVSGMSAGGDKVAAEDHLKEMNNLFNSLKEMKSNTETLHNKVSKDFLKAHQIRGKLSNLSKKIQPTLEDTQKAQKLYKELQTIEASLVDFQTGQMAKFNKTRAAVVELMNTFVDAGQVESPASGKIEHACWYLDWTSPHEYYVPEGVNMVNFFVGGIKEENNKFTLDLDSKVTSLKKLKKYVEQCKAKGVEVKVSIGGYGGKYDNAWNVLKNNDPEQVAKDLAAVCEQVGLAGIDFDYEEMGTHELDEKVGQLIMYFKKKKPNLQTSYCSNAQSGKWSTWQQKAQRVLNGATDENGKCYLDRFYIMSYYGTLEEEQKWVEGWVEWLGQEYGLEPSQVTVGINDHGSANFSPYAFAKWAAEKGLSTSFWAWDPKIPEKSNQISNGILKSYDSVTLLGKIKRVVQWVLYFFGLADKPVSLGNRVTRECPKELKYNLEKIPSIHTFNSDEDVYDIDHFTQKRGTSVYVDMGILYGSYANRFRNWNNNTFDQKKLNQFLETFFAKLQMDGAKTINLSFAQVNDIEKLMNKEKGTYNDKIASIINEDIKVGSTGQNFLKYLINYGNKKSVYTDISFGGQDGLAKNMKFPKSGVETANALVKFMKEYNIYSVDFDLEGSGVTGIINENGADQANAFFVTLHTFKHEEQKVFLTVEGNMKNGIHGVLKPLYENFQNKFDGVNLMLYSMRQYYLDANNSTWGITEWEKFVPASMINIGFFDQIDYTNPDSSAGKKYKVPTNLTNGGAAAFIYLQLLNDLGQTKEQLGSPFFWTSKPQNIPTDDFMSDFWTYLERGQR